MLNLRSPHDAVVTAALRASVAWSQRSDQPGAWREVARMAGVIMHVQASKSQIRTPMDLVAALRRPIVELLPEVSEGSVLGSLVLLDEADGLTDAALEVAADYTFALFDREADPATSWLPKWAWQRDEQVERAVFQATVQTGDQKVYTASRLFLIEHPAGVRRDLIDERNTNLRYAGAKAVAEYVDIPRDRSHRGTGDGDAWWWPCPACRWPMKVRERSVFCSYSPHEARFEIEGYDLGLPQLRKVSTARMRTPKALPVTGAGCLDPAVWRFITIPGLPEVVLQQLESEELGIRVTPWPIMDTFDALVTAPGFAPWTVDVKDHVDARRIIDEPPAARHVLVPKYRKSQIPQLSRALPDKTFWTVEAFMKHVRSVVNRGDAQ